MPRTLQGDWNNPENQIPQPEDNKKKNPLRFIEKLAIKPSRLIRISIIGIVLLFIFPKAIITLLIGGIFFSIFNVNLITIIIFLALIPIIFGIFSSISNRNDIPDLSKTNVLECKTQASDDKALCVEDTIKNIKDDWTRRCVEGNIDSKSNLANEIKSSQIQDNEIQDIDGLIKECMYYKTTQLAGRDSNDYPVLSNFISSAAGSFVGNYLANSLFNNLNNYNNYNYSQGGNYGSPIYNSTTPSQRSNNLGNIENQYKKDSWNISAMKSRSSDLSNYKLGDSGKNWLNTVYRNSSKSSSWSTYKSSSASSSSSSWSLFGGSKSSGSSKSSGWSSSSKGSSLG